MRHKTIFLLFHVIIGGGGGGGVVGDGGEVGTSLLMMQTELTSIRQSD